MDHNYEKNAQVVMDIAGKLIETSPSWLVIAGVGFGILGAGLLFKSFLKGPVSPIKAATLKGAALSFDDQSREAIREAFEVFYQSPVQPELRIGPSKYPMTELVKSFMADCVSEAKRSGFERELKIHLLDDCSLEQYSRCCELIDMMGGVLSVEEFQPITDYMTAGAAKGKKGGLPSYVVVRR